MLAEQKISEALGGRKVLGKSIKTTFEFADIIKQGLPAGSVFFLQKQLNLGDKEYSATLGVSDKWLGRYRKESHKHLSTNMGDRLYRIARIFKLAEEVFEKKSAVNRWLHRPQTGLNERVPLDLLQTEVGTKEVEELLYRIEYGIYS